MQRCAWKESVARKIISYNGSGKREHLNSLCYAEEMCSGLSLLLLLLLPFPQRAIVVAIDQ